MDKELLWKVVFALLALAALVYAFHWWRERVSERKFANRRMIGFAAIKEQIEAEA